MPAIPAVCLLSAGRPSGVWACEAGHEHVCAEVRNAEGWDYAHDEVEAALVRRDGTDAVAMDDGSI
jgi:hypothetical protein